MGTRDQIKILLQKHIDGTLTDLEKRDLLISIETPEYQSLWKEVIAERSVAALPAPSTFNQDEWEPVIQAILNAGSERIPVIHRVHFLRRWRWAAASVILLIAAGAYFLTTKREKKLPVVASAKRVDISPGKDGAILTLGDGSNVILDSLNTGSLATQNGTKPVIKNGQLEYEAAGQPAGEPLYNTMSTPRGRQFQLSLPDGTKVWLNAASSIHYPTVFTGRERKVELTGEAYFEVAKNETMPFRVSVTNKAEIEVLGTHFDVNAYDNETTLNTTLIEGAVKVRPSQSKMTATGLSQGMVLKPGQQAQISQTAVSGQPSLSSGIRVVDNADIEKVMAWKNGLFNFEGATLREVMRQLERWYDIQVIYEKDVPDIEFVGELSKNISLSDLLDILKRMQVGFRLEGERRLIVTR